MGTKSDTKAAPASNSKNQDSRGQKMKRPPRMSPMLVFSLLFLLGLFGGALWWQRPASPGTQLSLDRIVNLANKRQVKSARFLDEDARVVGTAIDDSGKSFHYWTSISRSDALTNDLTKTFYAGDSRVTVDQQSGKAIVRFVAQFLLPLVILANLFALLISSRSGSGSGASEFLLFGRIGDKKLGDKAKQATTFADVAAAGEAVVELSEVRDYLADPRAFEAMGAQPPKGVLLVGPPGCGKTLLARAVAGEAKASFFSISGSEFVESLVGVGAARVRDLFRQARTHTPAIIFVDELDAVGRQRGAGLGGGHDEREQTLNEMLVQIDGFSPTEGVVVMGATNRPDILDPALLRAGRFDRHVTVERPDNEGRLEILNLHAKGRKLADPATDLPYIAKHTPGFTGADLANVINESALMAVRERATTIARPHLDEAVERVLSGPKRKAIIITPDEKRRIAYHESGHAVVAAALGKIEMLQKLSIIARGRGIGHLAVLSDDKTILTRRDMESQVAIAMAGIASEELVFGEISTGSESDLERATNTARDMAGRYGMSDRLGRVRVLREHGEVFLGRDYMLTKDVSQPTLEHLDAEVRRILDEEEETAKEILSSHRDLLDGLAAALINQETLAGTELSNHLRGVRPYLKVAKPVAAAAASGGTRSRRRAPAAE